jgi:hypothetical protein
MTENKLKKALCLHMPNMPHNGGIYYETFEQCVNAMFEFSFIESGGYELDQELLDKDYVFLITQNNKLKYTFVVNPNTEVFNMTVHEYIGFSEPSWTKAGKKQRAKKKSKAKS